MPEIENDEPRPVLRNSVGKPTGVLPRNAQTMMIVAISAVMIAAIAFSGTASKTAAKPAPLPSGVTDPNQVRIAEYRSRLDEEARKLAGQQAEALEARRQFADAAANPAPANGTLPLGRRDSSSATQESDIDSDRRRRAYLSLFESNVALSYRKDNLAQASKVASPSPNPRPANAASPPSLQVPF